MPAPIPDGAPTTAAGNTASHSFAHTVTAAANLLLVALGFRGDATVVTVTYNGVPLTLVRGDACGVATLDVQTSVWKLVNPPAGALTVVATVSLSGGFVVGARSYRNVESIAAQGGSNGHAGSPSTVVASSGEELVVDVVHARNAGGGSAVLAVGAGQTQLWNLSDTGAGRGSGSIELGASSVAMDWTYSSQNVPHFAQSVLALKGLSSGIGIGLKQSLINARNTVEAY